jgi:hypothetical protein
LTVETALSGVMMVSRILWARTGIELAMTAMRMGRLNCFIKTDLLVV